MALLRSQFLLTDFTGGYSTDAPLAYAWSLRQSISQSCDSAEENRLLT